MAILEEVKEPSTTGVFLLKYEAGGQEGRTPSAAAGVIQQ
jgi:hypothetical protein